jgi:hypothetical protein
MKQGDRVNPEFCFGVAVNRMEVRWVVVVKVHSNRHSEKATHFCTVLFCRTDPWSL